MASQEYQQQIIINASRKRAANGNDSDSDEDSTRIVSAGGDVYKRRMHLKAGD